MQSTTAASDTAVLLYSILKEEGFKKKGLRIYQHASLSTLLIDVQPAKFQSGPYVNLGVYYDKYGNIKVPSIVQCHVSTRLTSLLTDPKRADSLLDPSSPISADARRLELSALLHDHAIPWLQTMSDATSARRAIHEKPALAHVAPIARSYLSFEDADAH